MAAASKQRARAAVNLCGWSASSCTIIVLPGYVLDDMSQTNLSTDHLLRRLPSHLQVTLDDTHAHRVPTLFASSATRCSVSLCGMKAATRTVAASFLLAQHLSSLKKPHFSSVSSSCPVHWSRSAARTHRCQMDSLFAYPNRVFLSPALHQ